MPRACATSYAHGLPARTCPAPWSPTARQLHVEQEVHDVAVVDDVLLAFHAQLAGRLDARFAAVLVEVFERIDLRANEALLEVGVDHAGRLGRRRPLADRPRANLFLASREVRLQTEQP